MKYFNELVDRARMRCGKKTLSLKGGFLQIHRKLFHLGTGSPELPILVFFISAPFCPLALTP